MLLRRSQRPVVEAIEALVGMQAQLPMNPYIGLWSRLDGFEPDLLSNLVVERAVVRVALMRSTIHLVSARDCLELRPLVQVASERGYRAAFGRRAAGLDVDAVVSEGRAILTEEPLPAAALGQRLQAQWPEYAPDVLANLVRTHVALVQVPPRGLWGKSGASAHVPADLWLGAPLAKDPSLDAMILRYVAAFGPATVQDAQTWSGLTKLGEVFDRLAPRLIPFRDEDGRMLYDLPDAPRPPADVDAPPRFLPDFDNVLLSHADRNHVVADEHRAVFMANNFVIGTVLIDGWVGATWKVVRSKTRATVAVNLLRQCSKTTRDAVIAEGERLLKLVAPESADHEIRVA